MSKPTRKITDNMGIQDSYSASQAPETEEFIKDIVAVFKKHNLALVPSYSGGPGTFLSLHDKLLVVPLKHAYLEHVRDHTSVFFEEPKPLF